ncbi:MAG: preprotein translocase subunit SecG [Nitrospirota bacterium]
MHISLIILHVFVAVILILMVLLQKGKGADIGAAFGGASQTVFGPRGAQSFLSKLTTGAAIIFMVTSLLLAIVESKRSSIMEGVKQEQSQTMPSAPSAPQPPASQPAK